MHKSATKCNETIGKWCKNKHGASKIIYTFETYHPPTFKPAVDTKQVDLVAGDASKTTSIGTNLSPK
jgi:hypothetical protein